MRSAGTCSPPGLQLVEVHAASDVGVVLVAVALISGCSPSAPLPRSAAPARVRALARTSRRLRIPERTPVCTTSTPARPDRAGSQSPEPRGVRSRLGPAPEGETGSTATPRLRCDHRLVQVGSARDTSSSSFQAPCRSSALLSTELHSRPAGERRGGGKARWCRLVECRSPESREAACATPSLCAARAPPPFPAERSEPGFGSSCRWPHRVLVPSALLHLLEHRNLRYRSHPTRRRSCCSRIDPPAPRTA